MAIKKESLNNFLPDGFETLNQEGYKENFSADKISTGYEKDVPDIVSGPNLNNLIDVIGKNTNTLNSYVEYLNSLSVNKTPIVDSNNQLNSTQIGLKVYSATETYLLNDLVTTIQYGKVHFYRSLVANNTGHDLTDEQYWEEVKLGSGSGLEVCDIGMALYVDETKGLRRYLNGQIVDINTNTQAFLNRLQEITTLHPSLLCTEEEWQTAKTMSVFGQVGKFVFNYADDGVTVVSVRIPAIVNVQGLFDLQNLGMTVGAGLPTHTHTRGTMNITGRVYSGDLGIGPNGAFYESGTSNGPTGNYASRPIMYFNASKSWRGETSNPIYSDNRENTNTVQPEAIQYPYFIQIATGSETENNIINDIELNNPYSLFDSKYSDHELNNLSWLKSEGQWNAKAVYPSAYDELLREYNSPDRLATFNKDVFEVVGNPTITDDGVASGFSVSSYLKTLQPYIGSNSKFSIKCDFTTASTIMDSYTLFGVDNSSGWYNYIYARQGFIKFIVQLSDDTSYDDLYINHTFTPKTNYSIEISWDGTAYKLVLYREKEKVSENSYISSLPLKNISTAKLFVGHSQYGNYYFNGSIDLKHFSITVDGVKVFSGAKSKVKLSTETYTDYDFVLNTADETFRLPLKTLYADNTVSGLSLYYYVGETVQNANLIDAGRIGEQLANKQDKCIHIIDTYVNGTSGYRIWSDGYCEQWGLANVETYVTLLKTYRDINYVILTSATNNTNSTNRALCGTPSGMTANEGKSVNSFGLWRSSYNANGVFSCYWETKGYLAVAQY